MHQMLLIRCIGFRIAYMYIQAKVGYQIMIFLLLFYGVYPLKFTVVSY